MRRIAAQTRQVRKEAAVSGGFLRREFPGRAFFKQKFMPFKKIILGSCQGVSVSLDHDPAYPLTPRDNLI